MASEAEAKRVKRLRERVPMTLVYSLIVTGSILLAGGVAGYFSFSMLYANKMSDGWGIMFMELERQALRLKDNLRRVAMDRRAQGIAVKIGPGGTLASNGALPDGLRLEDLGVDRRDLARPFVILEYGGSTYVSNVATSKPADPVAMLPVDLHGIMTRSLSKSTVSLVYLASRGGKLLFASDPGVMKGKLTERPLVRFFIDAPISQGHQLVRDKVQGDVYGFFHEIPGTNLVLFAETPKAALFGAIYESLTKFAGILFAILVAAVCLVQIPLAWISRPVKRLIGVAGEIAKGNFDVKLADAGIGEVAALGRAYSSMAKNLKERDAAIAVLNLEQKEKIRLDGELKIARTIQESLLPQSQHPFQSGLEVAAKYLPASEVAGDWYYHWFNDETRESIVCVVDVSGHGAGSSMFTAIIAGLFLQMTQGRGAYPIDEFFGSANRLIRKFGGGQWHASIQVVSFVKGSGEVTVHNAGHPPPLVLRRKGDQYDTENLALPSLAVGLAQDVETTSVKLPFAKDDSLILFTDGVYEARNGQGRQFGRKRIASVAKGAGQRSATEWVEGIHGSWVQFRAGVPAADDLCIVAVKAS